MARNPDQHQTTIQFEETDWQRIRRAAVYEQRRSASEFIRAATIRDLEAVERKHDLPALELDDGEGESGA